MKVVVKRTNDKRPFFDRHKDHPGGSIRIETDEPVEVVLTPHIAMAIRRGRLEEVTSPPTTSPPAPLPEAERGEVLSSAPRRRKKPYLVEDLTPDPSPEDGEGGEEA